jgi:hypothetical protein
MAFKIFSLIRARFFNQAGDTAVELGLNGEEQPRLKIDAGGRLSWGAGGAYAPDTNLYRYDANHLKTDDLLQAAAGIATVTTLGTPTVSVPDGTLAVDTQNDLLYFRSGEQWIDVSVVDGVKVLIQAEPPSGASSGDLWFDSDVNILYIYTSEGWILVTGSLSLGGLDDVSLTSVQDGQVLKYSAAGEFWYNEYEIPTNIDGGDAQANYGGLVAANGGGAAG